MAPYYVCAKCNIRYEPKRNRSATEMRPKKNGVYVIEMADFGPYKVWHADLWECPKCGHLTIAGFGTEPMAEHYDEKFQKVLECAKASDYVYYC